MLPFLLKERIYSLVSKIKSLSSTEWGTFELAIFHINIHYLELHIIHAEEFYYALILHLHGLANISFIPKFYRVSICLTNGDLLRNARSLAIEIDLIILWIWT